MKAVRGETKEVSTLTPPLTSNVSRFTFHIFHLAHMS